MNLNKLYNALLYFSIICACIFFFLWLNTRDSLEAAHDKIKEVSTKVEILTKDNSNLVEYNIKKDQKIKEVENRYKSSLKNIPADNCGDVKPSKELLKFFKENAKCDTQLNL